jgi:uncharacterized phage protein (TIGR02220 family)
MFRKVHPQVWSSPSVRSLSEDARLLWLYLLTCPHGASMGFYYLPLSYAAYDVQFGMDRLAKALKELCERKMAAYDQETSVALVLQYLKYNPIRRGPHDIGAKNHISEIPATPLFRTFLECLKEYSPDAVETIAEVEVRVKDIEGGSAKQPETSIGTGLELYEGSTQVQPEYNSSSKRGRPKTEVETKTEEVLEYLNQARGLQGRYRFTSAKGSGLEERLRKGVTVSECRLVIDHAISKWLGDERMESYIRPSTLFGAKKFDSYLIAAHSWDEKGRPASNGTRTKTNMDLEKARRWADG